MNFKNTINSTKETLKKQTKNLALSTALISSLTACGPSEKKADNATQADSIKTEVVAKDSVKMIETPVKKIKQNTTEPVEFDENDLKMMEDIDASFAEDKKEAEKTAQTPREKFGISKETYENAIKAHKEAENNLIDLLNVPEKFRDEEGLQIAKNIVDIYNRSRERLQLEISPKAQKAINIYNQKKQLNK